VVVVVGVGGMLDEEEAEEDAVAEGDAVEEEDDVAEVMVKVWLFSEWILTTSAEVESAM
jgi:hypothetical protein